MAERNSDFMRSLQKYKDKCFHKTKEKKQEKQKKAYLNSLRNIESPIKMDIPMTTQRTVATFFKDVFTDYDIFQIDKDTYSFCMEYSDISFTKASSDSQVGTFLNWVEYLNSFTYKTHIQVVNTGHSIKTEHYKQNYVFPTHHNDESLDKIAEELNKRIDINIGDSENTLENKQYLVVSQKAKSVKDAKESFMDILIKTEDKFKNMKSSLSVVSYKERLNQIYDVLHVDTAADHNNEDLWKKMLQGEETIYDLLAPKKIDFSQKDHIVIDDSKYLQVLYVSRLPKSLTPRFYNKIISMDMNLITTLNITPTQSAKIIKKIDKKIAGMDSEKYDKIKRASHSKVDYYQCPDRKLERRIKDGEQLQEDVTKNKQKIFKNNFLICITANSKEEMDANRNTLIETAMEHHVDLSPILFQQMEGLKNVLPLGHNTIQFQRSLTSEATGVNVPFDSKDLIQHNALYYGQNLSTRKSLFVDRKKLMNGNGCILATSGAGKSFQMKLLMEQIRLRYPDDDIIVIDPQREYDPVIRALKGEKIVLSKNSNTFINPFDLDMNYSLSDEDEDQNDPVKDKIEYIISFMESIMERTLSGNDKSIIDRCCTQLFLPYIESQYKDESLLPDLPMFYHIMLAQEEVEAHDMALVLERYVDGSVDMFAKRTNININNKVVCFDISNLSKSMQTTGYLVVLDHIMNRLAKNKNEGRFTWIFIDEFHILLKNQYSAEYITKIYKVGRKFHAIPTICTQNITEVLRSDYGCDILSNSEFALILKQKPLDLQVLSKIFDISKEEQNYVNNSPSGQGLLIYGEDCFPFKNEIPKDYYIYKLNETSSLQKSR